MSKTPRRSGQAASDDVKEKFRQALQRKHGHGGRDLSAGAEHGKVDHAQAAATSATQQMFRRKSG